MWCYFVLLIISNLKRKLIKQFETHRFVGSCATGSTGASSVKEYEAQQVSNSFNVCIV